MAIATRANYFMLSTKNILYVVRMHRQKIIAGKKKAMEIQFNWIFILIVGTIILLFFIKLSGQYQKNAEMELASDIIGKLSTISSSGKESTNTNQLIKINNLDLATKCTFSDCTNISCPTEFDFASQGVRAPPWMEIEPIFAPKKMTGDSLIMWSLDWSMPYRVCSILYLTTPGYQYILVYNDSNAVNTDFARKLLPEIKKNKYINVQLKKVGQVGTVEAVGDIFTKYVFLFNPTGSPFLIHDSVVKSKKWDVIYIIPGADPIESGTVYYSKQVGNEKRPDTDKKANYIGIPMLIGAIYSDDYEYYSCSVHKIMLKYKDLNTVYLGRTEAIYDYYYSKNDLKCMPYYSGLYAPAEFKAVNNSIVSYLNDKANFGSYAQELVSKADRIEEISGMANEKDCAELY
jgi:hypothetical protein